ncbi:laminin subunit beta-1, partial [Brachionus plicatilis]
VEQKISYINIYKTTGLILPNYCLEKHHKYEIEITVFKKSRQLSYNSAIEALFILIDSIIFIPNFDLIKNQIGLKNDEFKLALNCREKYLSLPKTKSDKCDRLMCAMTSSVFTLLPCQCNVSGSDDKRCDFFGGQCSCKPNVIGRQCNKCDPFSWDFSSRGCL